MILLNLSSRVFKAGRDSGRRFSQINITNINFNVLTHNGIKLITMKRNYL